MKMIKIWQRISIILIVEVYLFLAVEDNQNCKKLPNECKLDSYISDQHRISLYICDKLSQPFEFNIEETKIVKNCTMSTKNLRYVYFRLSHSTILDGSFDFRNIGAYLKTTDILALEFRFIKGFDINLEFNPEDLTPIDFMFYYSKFDFYSNGSLINSCADMKSLKFKSIFNAFNDIVSNEIHFIMSDYKTQICPLLFTDFSFRSLKFDGFINTFYKSNVLRFSPLNNSIIDINSRVDQLYLNKPEKIDLDSKILDRHAFKNLGDLYLIGKIVSIQKGLFKSFRKLKYICFDSFYFRKLIQCGGIDWMMDLNADFQISDYHNISSSIIREKSIRFDLIVSLERGQFLDVEHSFTASSLFPDQDFCLYREFPFDRLLMLRFLFTKIDDFTCTYLWLVQYYPFYWRLLDDYIYSIDQLFKYNFSRLIKECDFDKRLNNCNMSNFQSSKEITTSIFDLKERFIFTQDIILILTQIVCVVGICLNLLVIYTVSHKSNKKDLKENQYKYMIVNAVFNVIILVIEPITLISECHDFESMFCSRIRFWQFSQYFKIIFGEYVSNLFRLVANFAYVQFALNRLSLIGKNHGKLVTVASELNMCQFATRILIPCLVLPVVKIFRFLPNSLEPESDYPNPIGHYLTETNLASIYAYLSFDILYDLINYVVFLVVNFVIDVKLAIKMKETIEEKEKNKSKLVSAKQSQEPKRVDPVKRIRIMVVLNLIIGLLLKILSAYNSIFDLVNFVNYLMHNKIDNMAKYFFIVCSYNHQCYTFEKLGNMLYLSSFSIVFIFYSKFDKRFKCALVNVLPWKKKQNNSKQSSKK